MPTEPRAKRSTTLLFFSQRPGGAVEDGAEERQEGDEPEHGTVERRAQDCVFHDHAFTWFRVEEGRVVAVPLSP